MLNLQCNSVIEDVDEDEIIEGDDDGMEVADDDDDEDDEDEA